MYRPYSSNVRPFLSVGSLLLFIGGTWGAKWAVATAIGLMLFCGWWVVATLHA
jgi:hypothetical protein